MTTNSKTALITGGSSGIGLDAARGFLEEGYNVVISGRNEDKLRQAIKTLGPRFRPPPSAGPSITTVCPLDALPMNAALPAHLSCVSINLSNWLILWKKGNIVRHSAGTLLKGGARLVYNYWGKCL